MIKKSWVWYLSVCECLDSSQYYYIIIHIQQSQLDTQVLQELIERILMSWCNKYLSISSQDKKSRRCLVDILLMSTLFWLYFEYLKVEQIRSKRHCTDDYNIFIWIIMSGRDIDKFSTFYTDGQGWNRLTMIIFFFGTSNKKLCSLLLMYS
jgi:hypothetical protein